MATTAQVAEKAVEEVAVFSFSANSVQAHHFVAGGLWVDAGGPEIAKYIPFTRQRRWRVAKVDGGAAPIAKRASLRLPVPRLDDARVRVSLSASRAQSISLYVGGKRVARQSVAVGKSVLSAPVGAVAGELMLELRSRGRAVVVDSVWVGPASARVIDRQPPWRHGELRLTEGDELLYYLYLPDDAIVRGRDLGPCPVEVAVSGTGDEVVVGGASGLDLSEHGGQIVALRVSAGSCGQSAVRDLSIYVPASASAPASSAAVPQAKPPQHVLLWIMDTLRADRVSLVNPEAPASTPALERLAARGAVFRHAYVQGNESQTSHASLWTGTYPAVHGVRSAGDGGRWNISHSLSTLGEQLRDAGMKVVGVTGNGMITADAGYGRGFTKFINLMRADNPERRNGWIPAPKIVAAAMKLFRPLARKPSALFIGTIDNHKPYVGHQPWLDQLHPQRYRGPFERAAWPRDLGIVRGSMTCDAKLSKRDLTRIVAIYDSNISYQDQALGEVLDTLEEWGILDDTLIIVTADHGEELWEDGRCGHGASSRDSLVHVPLFISYPPGLTEGAVIEQGVDVADVFPTVLELLHRPVPPQVQSQSLVGIVNGDHYSYPRPSYASQYEYAHVMRIGRWKLRAGPKGTLVFYDIEERPIEKRDASKEHPIAYAHLRDSLQMFLSYRHLWKKELWGTANRLSPKGALALRALERDNGSGLSP